MFPSFHRTLACLLLASTALASIGRPVSGITEDRLPRGSTTQYRDEPNAWLEDRPYIIAGAFLLVLQAGLIAGLLLQRVRRRRIEQTLQETAHRYRIATVAGSVGVWDWNIDTEDLYVDPELKRILGFEDAEIPNRVGAVRARIHPDDRERVSGLLQACVDGKSSGYRTEHRMVHKDGSVRWFQAQGSVLSNSTGASRHFVGTISDITERKKAEEAFRESDASLKASHREIQSLAGRLIVAQEAERTRIARDLHDDVSQQLAALSIALSTLKRRVGATAGGMDIQGELALLLQRTSALAENVRNLSHDLHPGVLRHAGLVAALAGHCADLRRQHSLDVTFHTEGDVDSVDPETALCLYRVAQEALRNVVSHAAAAHAEVRLTRESNGIQVTISDDGQGFDARARERRQGLGLTSIQERVRLAGGTVTILSEAKKGTRVRVEIPVRPSCGQPMTSIA